MVASSVRPPARETEQPRNPLLVAIDLDGTLLDPSGGIGLRTRQAIQTLRASGVAVILASGRSPWSMREACQALGLDGPQITMQGALLASPLTGASWGAWTLSAADVRDHLELARACGTPPALCFADGWRAEDLPVPGDTLPRILQAEGTHFQQVPSLWEWAGRGAIRTFLYTTGENHARVLDAARRRFGSRYALTWGDEHGIELLAGEASKGTALRAVARRLGIPVERVVAIGDGPNDLSMFAAAGVSVAMGAAPPEVRAAADMVVGIDAAEGVYEALLRLFPATLEGTARRTPRLPRIQHARLAQSGSPLDVRADAVAAAGDRSTRVGELDLDLWFG